MKVLVTGATGFTGSYVVRRLLQQDIAVRCFMRPTSKTHFLPADQIEIAYGDLEKPDTLRDALTGVDALVNVASIGFGHAPMIVKLAEDMNVYRAIFVSTTAIFTTLNATSKTMRLAAERVIQESALRYTILRPTMIYGSSRDRNMSRLIRYLNRWRIIPIVGSGQSQQQPVYVEDVANAIVDALPERVTHAKCYNIAGAHSLTYNEVVDTISGALGKSTYKLHVPASPIIGTLQLFERLGLTLPIKTEQIQRLNEDKVFDFEAARRDFGYSPVTFREGITRELSAMNIA